MTIAPAMPLNTPESRPIRDTTPTNMPVIKIVTHDEALLGVLRFSATENGCWTLGRKMWAILVGVGYFVRLLAKRVCSA
jgi:hypothetical protein